MNKVFLVGRLAKDPVIKNLETIDKTVTTFSLAVSSKLDTKDNQGVDFIPISVWGRQAENVAKYMEKGRLVCVSGRIHVRKYKAEDETFRYVTEVVADQVQFLDSKKTEELPKDEEAV